MSPSPATPEWVKHAIFYQIFPDRFAKSPTLPKPAGIEPWDGDPTPRGYKGGDLVGVRERLDELQELGVTALYFTPVFQSASNHRYHTHDYERVDPLLGGDEAFDALLAECHRRGVRVVLDGVFNHASRGFFQFNDILENGRASPWFDWFTVDEPPFNAYDHGRPPRYLAWANLHALPKFNTDNPEAREFLMRVGERWLRKGIDGWRLDVAAEITSPGFWAEFRARTKAINPDAYLVGEIWEDARPWLQGDQFDGVMNYPWTEAVISFTVGRRIAPETVAGRSYAPWPPIDGRTFADRVDELLSWYAWPIQCAQLNLLDSHDTSRLISIAGGDAASVRLATLLLMTFPGAPSIYYGDEIGLTGALPDHWVRKPFPWDHPERWDMAALAFHRAAIALRKTEPALRVGDFRRLYADADVYAFGRALDGDLLLVALNVADAPRAVEVQLDAPDGGEPPHRLFATDGEPAATRTPAGVAITLPARAGAVFTLTPAGGR